VLAVLSAPETLQRDQPVSAVAAAEDAARDAAT
jgi:hypothetical protein